MRIFSLLLFVSVLTLFSCANEFELNAPYQDIAVVYGFLNQDDPVHYIRVEKAFIDDEVSGLEIAKNPDSLYYENVLVQLVRLDKNETITLERINGDEVGLPREEGIFANTPNILYGFSLPDDNKLEGEEQVELRIFKDDDEKPVTAQTSIIGDMSFQRPNSDPNAGAELDWQYNRNTNFVWFAREGGVLFDLILYINFLERVDDELVERRLEWVIQRNIRRERETDPTVRYDINGELFYQFLQDELGDEPRRQRFFQSIDVQVLAGGQELKDFLDITLANTGITSAQEVPTFTNLSEGGVGLLTSRKQANVVVGALSEMTRDSLRSGIYTKDLNFQ